MGNELLVAIDMIKKFYLNHQFSHDLVICELKPIPLALSIRLQIWRRGNRHITANKIY